MAPRGPLPPRPDPAPSNPLHAQRLWAHCQVPHFSWFLVVSRPVSDSCLVPPEGTLLYSSGHPGVKVIFPPGVTTEPRRVHMQVWAGQLSRVTGRTAAGRQVFRWSVCPRWCVWPAEPCWRSQRLLRAPCCASPRVDLPASCSQSLCSCLCPLVSQVTGSHVASLDMWPRGGGGECSKGKPLPRRPQSVAPPIPRPESGPLLSAPAAPGPSHSRLG